MIKKALSTKFSIIPKDNPKQALRIRRFLMAFAAYIVCGFLCYFAYLAGYVETEAFFGWLFSAIFINIILYVCFRTGLNQRMTDPRPYDKKIQRQVSTLYGNFSLPEQK